MIKQKTKSIIEEPASCTTMNGLEVITVRTAYKGDIEKVIEYCARFFDTIATGEENSLSAFRSAFYESDLTIQIHCKFKPPDTKKSLIGLQLAKGLRDFGIISHTLWIEQHIGPIEDEGSKF